MLHVQYENSYEQDTSLCNNLYFELEIACKYCDRLIGGYVFEKILKVNNLITLFCTLWALLKLVTYTFMSHISTSINILCIYMGYKLLELHLIVGYIKLNM